MSSGSATSTSAELVLDCPGGIEASDPGGCAGPTKLLNIQALRGLAIISVAIFHLIIIERKYGGARTVLPKAFEFGMFGVDLFFVISGFVMVVITSGSFQKPRHALKFLRSRLTRIYPLYWVYSLLLLAVFLVRPTWVHNAQGNQVDLWSSFLLLPSERLPLVLVGWTLIHEMYFYLVFFLILLLCPRRWFVPIIGLWAAAVVALNLLLSTSNPTLRVVSHPLTVEFMAGCLIGVIYLSWRKSRIPGVALLLGAGLGVLAAMLGHLCHRHLSGLAEPPGWWRVLVFGVPSVLIVYCATQAERNGRTLHRWLVRIGDASYSIYLSHILALSVLGRIWQLGAGDGVWDNVIALPLAILIVVQVGFLSYRMLERPLLRLTRKAALRGSLEKVAGVAAHAPGEQRGAEVALRA